MGNLRLVAAILFIGACGNDNANAIDARPIDSTPAIDAKVFMDAPPPTYDFSCMTNPAPAAGSATANVTVSGTVQEVSLNGTTPTVTALDGATLNACKAGAANCSGGNKDAGPVTSAGGGMYSLGPIATNTNPIDTFIAMTKTGDRDTYVYAPQPIAMDLGNVPVLTFTNTAFTAITTFLSIQQSAANGTLGVAVTDCANMPVDGATIVVQQGGNPVANTTDLDTGTLDPSAAGGHIVFNVPPGDTEVSATLGSMTFRARTVKVVAASTTETIVRPGYL